jgi:hypothetical protein
MNMVSTTENSSTCKFFSFRMEFMECNCEWKLVVSHSSLNENGFSVFYMCDSGAVRVAYGYCSLLSTSKAPESPMTQVL